MESETKKILNESDLANFTAGDEMNAMQSKAFIDEIDVALADAIGLSPEELDFVTSYDIKYRMGSGSEEANTD
jgi:hypothetical protein